MNSHASIILALGGYAKVAEALGLPKGTVSAMQHRNSIATEYWMKLAEFAAHNEHPEITVEALARTALPRRRGPIDPRPAPNLAEAAQ